MKPINGVAVIAVCLTSVCVIARGQGTGEIAGVVEDPTGNPIAGVFVSIGPQPTQPIVAFRATAITAQDGSFQITAVPAGSFYICPAARNSDLLPGCTWGPPPSVTITDGQRATIPPIRLSRGYRLQIRVDDRTAKISNAAASRREVGLLIIVRSLNSGQTMATPASVDSNGYNYQAVVPFETDLTLLLGCHNIDMTDSRGASVPRSDSAHAGRAPSYRPLTVRVPSGQTIQPIVFNVINAGTP